MILNTVRVLLVDDAKTEYVRTRHLLSDMSDVQFQLDWVAEYGRALEAMERNQHDVYLVDYRLGPQTGVELLRAAIRNGCKGPMILLTGQGDRAVDLEAMEAGAADYLNKAQIDAPLLERSIRYCMERHQRQRAVAQYENACQLMDDLSHEFRTPLTVIKEFACIVRDGIAGPVNGEQQEYLDIVVDRVEDLSHMVNDILDISRLDAGRLVVCRRSCRVSDIVEHVRPLLERKAGANKVQLEIQLDADLPQVYCDPEGIGRVILNLGINAIKFCGEGKQVRLWAQREGDRAEVKIGVTDKGPGIREENLKVIFERFKQVDGNARLSTKGFGLGLSIAKELVRLNFGEIMVQSRPGQGSTFSFTVPAAEPFEVIVRYISRIEHLLGGSLVSLVAARIPASTSSSVADEVDELLQHLLKASDVVLRPSEHGWLLVVACPQHELGGVISRIQQALAEANRNRPFEPLPTIAFDIQGTWRSQEETYKFITQFQAALQAMEEVYA